MGERSEADDAATQRDERAEEAYIRGLIERGEAAWPVNGELPPGATHEIVEERPGEVPKIRRRRFA
jgi:hypothetical protein